jgi:hypothetical protein
MMQTGFWCRNLNVRSRLENMLRWYDIIKIESSKNGKETWIGLIWLTTGAGAEFFDKFMCFVSIKRGKIRLKLGTATVSKTTILI